MTLEMNLGGSPWSIGDWRLEIGDMTLEMNLGGSP
jgi:hypothetical protein